MKPTTYKGVEMQWTTSPDCYMNVMQKFVDAFHILATVEVDGLTAYDTAFFIKSISEDDGALHVTFNMFEPVMGNVDHIKMVARNCWESLTGTRGSVVFTNDIEQACYEQAWTHSIKVREDREIRRQLAQQEAE